MVVPDYFLCPFVYRNSHTDVWVHFPLAPWWLLKRVCNSLAFGHQCSNYHPGFFAAVCDWSHLDLMVHGMVVMHLPTTVF